MNKFNIISFLILTSFSSFSFAGAAEDRSQSIIDQALSTKSYSSAAGNNYTVGGVKADNGKLVATVAQKVVVDGSAATVTQKVSIPANDAFYKKTAGFAKGLLRGGAVGLAASLAIQRLLNGVGYVMGEGGKVQKKVDLLSLTEPDVTYCVIPSGGSRCNGEFASVSDAINYNKPEPPYQSVETTYSAWNTDTQYYYCQRITRSSGVFNTCYTVKKSKKTNPPTHEDVSDPEMNDAFSNWFKNNPSSVTDPVTTYIYSPKTATGAPATTPQKDPSFGQQEITDEMMDNYLANRNAELYANDVAANQAAIRDSAQTETEAKPDGTKTETKTNPDGSKTETKTETKTNPDTGEVETTVTETVINPDGSRGPSKQTETKTETKPNPETSKLPAACEYFTVLCDWIGWTKENPDMPEEDPLLPQELDIGSLNTGTFQATAGCPADIQVPVSFGGASKSIAISYEPICALAQKWSFIAPLIGFISGAMILIGVGRKGEDGDS